MAATPPPSDTDWPGIVELLKAFLPGGLPIGALAGFLGWRRWKAEHAETVDKLRDARIDDAERLVYSRMKDGLAASDVENKRLEEDRDAGWRGLNRARDGWQQCYHEASGNETMLLVKIVSLSNEAEADTMRKRLRPLRWPPDAEVLAGRTMP